MQTVRCLMAVGIVTSFCLLDMNVTAALEPLQQQSVGTASEASQVSASTVSLSDKTITPASSTAKAASTAAAITPTPDQAIAQTSIPTATPDPASTDATNLLPLNPNSDDLALPTQPGQLEIIVTQPLTLEQAQELGQRNNLTLQTAELQLRQSQASLRQALASLYPNLNLQSSITRTVSPGGQFTPPTLQFQQQSQLQQQQQSQLQQQLLQQQQQASQTLQDQIQQLQQRFEGPQLVSFTDQQNVELQQLLNQLQQSAAEAANTLPPQPVSLSPLILATTNANAGGSSGGGSGDTLNGSLSLVYNIFSSGSRSASIRAAREQVRLAELEVQRQAEQLRLDVSNDYYNAQQADVQVRIAQAAVNNAQTSLQDTQALFQAGLGTRFDVLQAQVTLANTQQNLTDALSVQRTSRRQLVQRLNLSDRADVSLADPVQLAGEWPLSLEQTIVTAFQNRAELEQRLAQRNIALQSRRIALASLGPQVSLFASLNSLDVLTDDFLPRYGYAVGLQLNWNFFDGGASRASAAQQEANAAIAETQFATTKNQIRLQVEQAYFALQANRQNVQTARAAVAQATEGLRLARLRFQAGVGTQADVTNAEADLTQAQGNLLAATLDYNRSLAILQRAVGYRVALTPLTTP